ncbi:outer membrane protein [Sandarakinorhabdus sp. DWP1-3-1]|uniref:outer membrane protein n=1 Tax=Sandarakinorhabdus sp. DWP1-3-1 TaxID=2804627 RepID=UPI003CEC4AD6
MFKSVFALAALAVAAPALAQGTPESFNGPFVGVQGGWQQDRQTLDVTDSAGTFESRQNKDGFAYGGQIGYDFRLSPTTVLGAEVALTGRTGTTPLDGFNSLELKQGRTISATARLGYLVNPDGLVYVRGGYSNARFTIRDANTDISEDRDGFQVGVGYEQLVARNVSARIEYAYSRFGTDNLPALAADLGANQAELKYTRNAVTAGLNFRF